MISYYVNLCCVKCVIQSSSVTLFLLVYEIKAEHEIYLNTVVNGKFNAPPTTRRAQITHYTFNQIITEDDAIFH